MLSRYLEAPIRADLAAKMVFLAGPRQVGKTTVARSVLAARGAGAYYSWDRLEDRRFLRRPVWPAGEALVVLDELHKLRGWKRWLKGEFDSHGPRVNFLVTGSARLDLYRRGGDSLQGRYHHYRLHPFSLAELRGPASGDTPEPFTEVAPPGAPAEDGAGTLAEDLEALVRFGGFPEPLLARSERTRRRWRKERLERFFREDVRELDAVRDLSSIQLLGDLLPERVGSPLSLNSLREDLDASHRAVSHWVDVLERLYYVYLVRPFTTRAVRGLRKMAKAYLWDWSLVEQPGPRFENLVASHLLKFCHRLEDVEGFGATLHYLRDVTGREVDFLVAVDRKPWFAVEVKLDEQPPSPHLRYFRDRLSIPFAYQVSLRSTRDVARDGLRCLPAARFLAALA